MHAIQHLANYAGDFLNYNEPDPVQAAEIVRDFQAMREALQSIGRDDDGDAMLDAVGMDDIEAILARIDGEA